MMPKQNKKNNVSPEVASTLPPRASSKKFSGPSAFGDDSMPKRNTNLEISEKQFHLPAQAVRAAAFIGLESGSSAMVGPEDWLCYGPLGSGHLMLEREPRSAAEGSAHISNITDRPTSRIAANQAAHEMAAEHGIYPGYLPPNYTVGDIRRLLGVRPNIVRRMLAYIKYVPDGWRAARVRYPVAPNEGEGEVV